MIDFEAIEEAIKEIEDGELTLGNCRDLASLYIIRTQYAGAGDTNQDKDLASLLCDYLCLRDKYKLINFLLAINDTISEIYHTCPEEEKKEIQDFIYRLSSITTPTIV